MRVRIRLNDSPWRQRVQKALLVGLWLLGGGVAVGIVFAMSFFGAMRVEMRSTEVRVPDLAGMTLDAAGTTVDPLDLVLLVADQRHDPAVASGRVLQQAPRAGASVRRGRKVKLVMSLGGRVLEVPDLIGEASRAVEIELRQTGFAPGDQARAHSPRFASGRIIAQTPPPGTPSVPNARVHSLVSAGPRDPAFVMPDLSGLDRPIVERWIDGAGFRKGAVRRVESRGRPSGIVVGQLPLAGYPVRSKDVVELTVTR